MVGTSVAACWTRRIAATVMLSALAPLAAVAQMPLPTPDLHFASGGYVNALVVQPDGSRIIGGRFSSVNGVARQNIARILADGSVDLLWNPGANDTVNAMALRSDNDVCVGGRFTYIGGHFRPNLACLDGTGSGAFDSSFAPVFTGEEVSAIAVAADGSVYTGGYYSDTLKYSRAGAQVKSWHHDGSVYAIAIAADGSVFIGGTFAWSYQEYIGGVAKLSQSGVSEYDQTWTANVLNLVSSLAIDDDNYMYVAGFSGFKPVKILLTPQGEKIPDWAPTFNNTVWSLALGPDGMLYAGGLFSTVNGAPQRHVARVSTQGNGALDTNWNPEPNKGVSALGVDDAGNVHVGGSFTAIAGEYRLGAATLDAAGDPAAAVDAESSGNRIYAMVEQSDGGVILAGSFLKAGGLPRRGLARLRPDGQIDPDWAPVVDGRVEALALGADGSIYAGGVFTSANGVARSNLAKFSGTGTGALDTGWTASAIGDVKALTIDGAGRIYVGGSMTSINNDSWFRTLARLGSGNPGALDTTWRPAPDKPVWTLHTASDGAVYVGGEFNTIGGLSRNLIARVSPNWSGGFMDAGFDARLSSGTYFRVHAIHSDGNHLYVGGGFVHPGATALRRLVRFTQDGDGPVDATWTPEPDSIVRSILVDDDAVYVGGQFAQVGGAARRGLARLWRDGDGSVDRSWNYSTDTLTVSTGGQALLLTGADRLLVGGKFETINAIVRRDLASVPAQVVQDTALQLAVQGDAPIVGATYTVHVAASSALDTPRGDVTLHAADGGSCGPVRLVNGEATCQFISTTAGTQRIDATFAPSVASFRADAAFLDVAVAAADTTIQLSAPDIVAYGDSVAVQAALVVIAPGTGSPSGVLQLHVDGTFVCAADVATGLDCMLPVLDVGTHEIVASYDGSGDFNATSASALLHVERRAPSLTIAALSPTPSAYGTPVQVTVALGNTVDASGVVVVKAWPSGVECAIDAAAADRCQLDPGDAGTYVVTAQYDGDPRHELATAPEAGHVVVPASAQLSLGNLLHVYDGTPKHASLTSIPASIPLQVLYDGAPSAPIAAGEYRVVATAIEGNHVGEVEGILIIEPADAVITLGGLQQVFDGTPRTVTVQTVPADLAVLLTYDGNEEPPLAAGSYSVVARVVDPDHRGETTGTLQVSPAADLVVSTSNGVSAVVAGTLVSYEVLVLNNGPSAVDGATLQVPTPAALSQVAWTCETEVSEPCAHGAGTGGIDIALALAPDEALRFTMQGIVSMTATVVQHEATLSPPVGTIELVPVDNVAQDDDPVLPHAMFADQFEAAELASHRRLRARFARP